MLSVVSAAGYDPVFDVAFEHGHWEVETLRGQVQHELQLDPLTAKILFDQMDD